MSDRYLQKTDRAGLMRDPATNAILNTDNAGYVAYKRKKAIARQNEQRMNQLETDVGEIKSLLHQLLTKVSK